MAINITFPPSIDMKPYVNGFQYSIGRSDVITTDMDTGPKKSRRRSQAAPRPVTFPMILTRDQLEVFEDWYDNTLQGGILPFEANDPIYEDRSVFYRFANPQEKPVATPLNNAALCFTVTLNLQILP